MVLPSDSSMSHRLHAYCPSSSHHLFFLDNLLTTLTDYKLLPFSLFSAQYSISPFCSQILLSISKSHTISFMYSNSSIVSFLALSRTKVYLVLSLLYYCLSLFWPLTLYLFCSNLNIPQISQAPFCFWALNLLFLLPCRYIQVFDKLTPFQKNIPWQFY